MLTVGQNQECDLPISITSARGVIPVRAMLTGLQRIIQAEERAGTPLLHPLAAAAVCEEIDQIAQKDAEPQLSELTALIASAAQSIGALPDSRGLRDQLNLTLSLSPQTFSLHCGTQIDFVQIVGDLALEAGGVVRAAAAWLRLANSPAKLLSWGQQADCGEIWSLGGSLRTGGLAAAVQDTLAPLSCRAF